MELSDSFGLSTIDADPFVRATVVAYWAFRSTFVDDSQFAADDAVLREVAGTAVARQADWKSFGPGADDADFPAGGARGDVQAVFAGLAHPFAVWQCLD